jgi:hypothetical protein
MYALLLQQAADRSYETWLRYGILLAGAPFWWPVVRALYQELQDALWKEGGLFGRRLSAREMAERARMPRAGSNPLVSEPWAHRRAPRAGAAARPAAGAGAEGAARAPAPLRGSAQRGFRRR